MLRLSLPRRAGRSGHRCHKGSGGGREKSHPEEPSKNPPQERAHHQKRILLSLRATELGTAASPCPRPHPREFQPLSCTWVDNHGTAPPAQQRNSSRFWESEPHLTIDCWVHGFPHGKVSPLTYLEAAKRLKTQSFPPCPQGLFSSVRHLSQLISHLRITQPFADCQASVPFHSLHTRTDLRAIPSSDSRCDLRQVPSLFCASGSPHVTRGEH